ncbi:MAG TPA: hypothetical protein VFZ75_01500 [Actinomycetota bacterium]|nr:hypothetical protein [Actinomycetota bacterium]
MRRRLAWLLAALLAVLAAPTPVRSADADSSPRVHVAGIDRTVHHDDGSARASIPWLARPGSERRAAAVVASSASSAASPLAPVVVPPTFDGIPNIDPPLATPADPTGALGMTYHLAAVNTHMAFYDRTGVQFGPTRRLRTLDPELAGKNVTDFDPKVVYDYYGQHFLLVFLSRTDTRSFLSVVVIPEGSEGTTNGWCTLHMSGDQVAGNGKQFADYPSVGFTESRVTIATNQYDFSNAPSIGGFRYVQIISMGKGALYDCERPVVPIKVFSRTQTRDPDGSRAFTIVPAVSIAGAPTAQFMTSIDFNGSSGKLILWRLTVVDGKFKLVRTRVAGGPMSIPRWGRQCGNTKGLQSKWDTGDVRLTSAFWDAALGRLYTATSIAGNLGGGSVESVVRWWEVDPAATLANSTVPRRGIVGRAGRDAAWPSVATDSEGKLWVNYARAGVSECLAAMASVVQPGATGHAAVSIRTGSGRYEASSGPERWGDYTAVSRDPQNGTQMAAYGAHPIDDGGGPATELWQQVIATLTDV